MHTQYTCTRTHTHTHTHSLNVPCHPELPICGLGRDKQSTDHWHMYFQCRATVCYLYTHYQGKCSTMQMSQTLSHMPPAARMHKLSILRTLQKARSIRRTLQNARSSLRTLQNARSILRTLQNAHCVHSRKIPVGHPPTYISVRPE